MGTDGKNQQQKRINTKSSFFEIQTNKTQWKYALDKNWI